MCFVLGFGRCFWVQTIFGTSDKLTVRERIVFYRLLPKMPCEKRFAVLSLFEAKSFLDAFCFPCSTIASCMFCKFLDQQFTGLQWLYAACAMRLGVQHAMLCEAKGRLIFALDACSLSCSTGSIGP